MGTTTVITAVDYRVSPEYYAEFVDDFDTDAIDDEVLAELNALLPEGVSVARNGQVFATLEAADAARALDWQGLLSAIDVDTIVRRHAS